MDNKERDLQLINEVNKGLEAKKLTNTNVWKDVIKEMEDTYVTAIRSGSWINFSGGINIGKKAREENVRRLQVLDELVVTLTNKIATGEEAQKRLEAMRNGSKQRRS